MKKIYILLTLVLGFAATSCQNGTWEDDVYTGYTIWNKTLQEHNVISIQELKAKYNTYITNQNQFAEITTDSMLRGTVICTDDGGNLTQQLVLQDGTKQNPGFIIIGVNMNALYNHIQPGQEILLSLKGLYIGGYGSNGQLGFPSKNAAGVERIGRMSQQDFWDHVKFTHRYHRLRPGQEPQQGSVGWLYCPCQGQHHTQEHRALGSGSTRGCRYW